MTTKSIFLRNQEVNNLIETINNKYKFNTIVELLKVVLNFFLENETFIKDIEKEIKQEVKNRLKRSGKNGKD